MIKEELLNNLDNKKEIDPTIKLELEKKIEEKIDIKEIRTKIKEVIEILPGSFSVLNDKALVYRLPSKEHKEIEDFLEELKKQIKKGETEIWSGVHATIDDIIMEFLKGKIKTWLKENNEILDEESIRKISESIKLKVLKAFDEKEIASYVTNLKNILMMYNPSSRIIEQSFQWTGK